MFCKLKKGNFMSVLHFIDHIIDDEITCLCGKKFNKANVIVYKSRPKYDSSDCSVCSGKLEPFWRKTVREKIFTKVEGTSLHRVGNSDNMVMIKGN